MCYFCESFSKIRIYNFIEISGMKFHENRSSGSLVVPFGRTDGQTDGPAEARSTYSLSPTCLGYEVYNVFVHTSAGHFRSLSLY